MKKISTFLVVCVLGILLIHGGAAFGQNKVLPIDATGIKKLLASRDCPLLVVATAAWCRPCREELPTLNKIYLKYKEQGFNLVAISLDIGGPSDMQRLVDKLHIAFPVYWGGNQMAFDYEIFGVPTILIVKDGKIVERVVGKRTETFLEDKVVELLGECEP